MSFNKSYLVLGILIIILVPIFIFLKIDSSSQNLYLDKTPEKVVRQYFESWDIRDYEKMYATISDGFKRIDPNAKNIASFTNYASSQNIENIKIKEIYQISNNEKTAVVRYSVEFILGNRNSVPFNGEFTLKYRENDTLQGWKLIHPYGENIDTS